jgi:single-strand DNA-binding protein
MNIIVLGGNIARKNELKNLPSGMSVIEFSVATSEYMGKEKGSQAMFHRCKAFGKTAENIDKYFNKGSQVFINGKLSNTSYEKDGVKKYYTDIIVNSFDFGAKAKGSSQDNSQQEMYKQPKVTDKKKDAKQNTFTIPVETNPAFTADDIPF